MKSVHYDSNCETQPPASIGWVALSSVIVRCLFVRRPASVTSPLISTIWYFRAYKQYIFCEDMILATCQCQQIFCCWVEPSLLLSSFFLSSTIKMTWKSLEVFLGPIRLPKVSFWGLGGLVCIKKLSLNFDCNLSAIFGTHKMARVTPLRVVHFLSGPRPKRVSLCLIKCVNCILCDWGKGAKK